MLAGEESLEATRDDPTEVDRFKLLKRIGEGTYGVVYRARDSSMSPVVQPKSGPLIPDDSVVALKKMRLDAHDEGVPVTTLREVALLKDLNHANIVRLRDVIPMPPKLYLVFDYMDYDLKQCLDLEQFHKGMPQPLIQSCMHQILSG